METVEINIKSMRSRIEEAGSLEDRRREARTVLPQLRAASDALSRQVDDIRGRFQDETERRTGRRTNADPHTIPAEHHWANVLYMASVAIIILELLVSAVIAKTWLDLPTNVAYVIGAGVGLILSLSSKAGVPIVAGVATDMQRPVAVRRKISNYAVIGTVVNFILVVVVLSSRAPSENLIEFLIAVTGLALGLSGITLPVFAGSLLALAHDFDWSNRYEREFRRASVSLAEVAGFLNWCLAPEAGGADEFETTYAPVNADAQ